MDSNFISENLTEVRERLTKAVQRSGRSLADITLLAATKTVPVTVIQEIWRCGIRHIGENRIQEADKKRSDLKSSTPECDFTWHFIGHLQSNKVKKAVELFDVIQSLDSLPLSEAINREAEKRGKTVPCLVEVKVSEEPGKFGVPSADLEKFLEQLASFRFLRVEGLMTMAPYFDEMELARPYFRKARSLFDRFSGHFKTARPLLSMGMSHDFEVAVEEGSNMIRIGTALFGQRPAPAR